MPYTIRRLAKAMYLSLALTSLGALAADNTTVVIGVPKHPIPGQAFRDCEDCPVMLYIPKGRFQMGTDNGPAEEGPAHTVSVEAFAMGRTEVTQGLWRAIMGSNPSNYLDCGDDCPVEEVSWDLAQRFVKRLSAKTGQTYRLPSEAEWEYACRAGGLENYCGSNDLNAVGWYRRNKGYQMNKVAQKQANAWGLYDMTGSVWEWVQDCYLFDGYKSTPRDSSAADIDDCSYRVQRGGSRYNLPEDARATVRIHSLTAERNEFMGLRIARDLNEDKSSAPRSKKPRAQK